MKFEHTERKLSLYKTRRKNSFMWLPIDEMAYRISRREKTLKAVKQVFFLNSKRIPADAAIFEG